MRKIPSGRMCITALFLFFLILTGCSKQKTVYLSSNQEAMDTETEALKSDMKSNAQDAKLNESNGDSLDLEASSSTEQVTCYVYLCGEVKNPGVYKVNQNSRIFEVIELAGGLLPTAATESINQAEKVKDGQMLLIPTQEEFLAKGTNKVTSPETEAASNTKTTSDKVNLNTATKEELLTLPGLGQIKVESILTYREKNGSFKSTDEIMKIEGIKEGVFSKIKDRITVN